MNPIRDAFDKIKRDISELRQEILLIKQQISQLNQQKTIENKLHTSVQTPDFNQTNPAQTPTQHPLPTDTPTHIPTHQQSFKPLEPQNLALSIGNRGVPTNKQTNQQTDTPTHNQVTFTQNNQLPQSSKYDDFEKAREILDSLDDIKKDIRLKFKRLTQQEMLVFSTLYSLEEQGLTQITYKIIANNLNLSESSIRDYLNRLLNKGIPILKTRQNNKTITLRISPNLKQIANLSTINKLREL